MSEKNYREMYRLDQPIKKASRLGRKVGKDDLDESVHRVMKVRTLDPMFNVHRRRHHRFEGVRFSTDHYHDTTPDILVLGVRGLNEANETKLTKVAALRYQAVGKRRDNQYYMTWHEDPDWNFDSENYMGICYVQTMMGVDRELYQKATEMLGARPHEFLVAQFLARAGPLLDARPQTKLRLNPSNLASNGAIRDRFFDKKYRLNHQKERVRQILGEDNAWLSDEAVARRTRG